MALLLSLFRAVLNRLRHPFRSVFSLVLIVLAVFALRIAVISAYTVPSDSMEPTLRPGDHVLALHTRWLIGSFHDGEVVVFHPPQRDRGDVCGNPTNERTPCILPSGGEALNTTFVKRIVAGPGELFQEVPDGIKVNGRFVREPFTTPCTNTNTCLLDRPIRIPHGYWYMLGDNRPVAEDSRVFGAIPTSWIIGPVIARYWPLDHIAFSFG